MPLLLQQPGHTAEHVLHRGHCTSRDLVHHVVATWQQQEHHKLAVLERNQPAPVHKQLVADTETDGTNQ